MDDEIPQLVEELPPDFTVQASHLATVLDTSSYERKLEDVAADNHNDKDNDNDNYNDNDNRNKKETTGPRKIPVTIITGYLGSGKSTLLEMVGRTSNRRLAIILNEFGDTADIEKAVTIQDGDQGKTAVQEWLDLGNGCLCCTVKDNGVMAIENLVERSAERIDHILLETTGVADPAPIARMFWLDEALSSSVYIDAVITVVDSANILACLDDVGGHWHAARKLTDPADSTKENKGEEEKEIEKNENSQENKLSPLVQEGITTAHLQIALADCVLLNKADLVASDPKAIETLTRRIRQINASVPVHATSYGDIALDKILDLHAFEASAVNALASTANDWVYHDDRIATVTLDFPFFASPAGFEQVEAFLQKVLWESEVAGLEVEIHRLKGILVCGDDVRVVQGVRDTYEIIENGRLPPSITENKLVFIGKDLVRDNLQKELYMFLDADASSGY